MKIKATASFPGAESKSATLEIYTPCYCNRDITVTELKKIVKELRNKEKKVDTGNESDWNIKQNIFTLNNHNLNSPHIPNETIHETFLNYSVDKQKKSWIHTANNVLYLKLGSEYYNLATNSKDTTVTSTNNFRVRESQIEVLGTKIFTSTRSENIKSLDEDNYTLFAEYLNKAFADYDIDTCIRKIHFLAQCYHESSKFHHTYEGKTTVPSNYKGGVDFQGRGIKQITHDYNYLACYDEQERIIHEESSTVAPFIPLFDIYIDKRDNINQSVTAYLAKYSNTHGFPDLFLETLKDFSKKIAENLKDACISAGFFWKHQDEEVTRLYEAADNDNVQELTNKINGGVTGLSQRQKYTDDLKIIFDYENCEKNQ